MLVGELAETGYLKGKAMPDELGATRGAVSWGMTVEGRLFLRRLEKEIPGRIILVPGTPAESPVVDLRRRCRNPGFERLVKNRVSCEAVMKVPSRATLLWRRQFKSSFITYERIIGCERCGEKRAPAKPCLRPADIGNKFSRSNGRAYHLDFGA